MPPPADSARGQQPPAPSGTPHPHHVLLGAISAIALVVALFAGIELARSNSDIICTKTTSDQGACSGGAWSDWAIDSQSTDANSCTTTYVEHRTYTGTRDVVNGSFTFSANLHTHCNVGIPGGAQGAITTSSTACQIVETRTRAAQGAGSGASCVPNTSSGGVVDQRTVTSQSRTETIGTSTTEQSSSGSYQDYLARMDSLATSTIWVVPTLVKKGDITRVLWTSDHMTACSVAGSNGDAWQKLQSDPKGEDSSPIMQTTTYTLTCTMPLGNQQVTQATVAIIPVFQEK